jgi:hypothetical protein
MRGGRTLIFSVMKQEIEFRARHMDFHRLACPRCAESREQADGKQTSRRFRLIANWFFVLWPLTVSDSVFFDGI